MRSCWFLPCQKQNKHRGEQSHHFTKLISGRETPCVLQKPGEPLLPVEAEPASRQPPLHSPALPMRGTPEIEKGLKFSATLDSLGPRAPLPLAGAGLCSPILPCKSLFPQLPFPCPLRPALLSLQPFQEAEGKDSHGWKRTTLLQTQEDWGAGGAGSDAQLGRNLAAALRSGSSEGTCQRPSASPGQASGQRAALPPGPTQPLAEDSTMVAHRACSESQRCPQTSGTTLQEAVNENNSLCKEPSHQQNRRFRNRYWGKTKNHSDAMMQILHQVLMSSPGRVGMSVSTWKETWRFLCKDPHGYSEQITVYYCT